MSVVSNARLPVAVPAAPAPEITNPAYPAWTYCVLSKYTSICALGFGAAAGGALAAGLFLGISPLGGVIFAVGGFVSGSASGSVVHWLFEKFNRDPESIIDKVESNVAPIIAVIAGTAALAIAGFTITPFTIGILTVGIALGAIAVAVAYAFAATIAHMARW